MFKRIVTTCLVAMALYCACYAQTVPDTTRCRRHFVIAFDISGPSLSKVSKDAEFVQRFISLFSNASLQDFDPAQDEISFYHFGVAREEFEVLRAEDKGLDPKGRFSAFCNRFLKDKHLHWSAGSPDKKNVAEFLSGAFQTEPDPKEFGQGVSLSWYVYPLIIEQLPKKYVQDMVLIIISDFLTGSDYGNKDDWMRIRELYGYDNMVTPTLIQRYQDSLSRGYFRVDYPAFSTVSQSRAIAASAYFINPKLGPVRPESYSLVVDGNLNLDQQGYQSEDFSLGAARLKFTHNPRFRPQYIQLRIVQPATGGPRTLFEKYFEDIDLSYDSIQQVYRLPLLTVTLPGLKAESPPGELVLEYHIDGTFSAASLDNTGYSYVVPRTVEGDQIHFTSSKPRMILYYSISALAGFLLIYMVTRLGRPQRLVLQPYGFADSYEHVDYEKHGKITTAYKFWDADKSSVQFTIRADYASAGYWFNWRPRVRLSIITQQLPKGFEVFLKADRDSTSEFYKDNPMPLVLNGKGGVEHHFLLEMRQIGGYKPISEPQLVKIVVSGYSNQRKLFGLINGSRETSKAYDFHIGPNLGDVWVGIDPGTTGSCIAAGSLSENILIGKLGKKREEIVGSKLVFDATLDYPGDPQQEYVPTQCYKYGPHAESEFSDTRQVRFQSIKKMLGFKTKRRVKFRNGVEIELSGKKLCSLLVDGLYRDYKEFVESEGPVARDLLRDGRFNPRRAVVAIPNNFTSTKIKDMLDCFAYLNQFKELRYVYEAEAIFFYYLYHYSDFNGDGSVFKGETVLVFDMGGATINTTVIRAAIDSEKKYALEILCKLGYGIGGDTIDYCTVRSILDHGREFPGINVDYPFGALKYIKPGDRKKYADTAIALQKMAFEVKRWLPEYYQNANEGRLLPVGYLENALRVLQTDLDQQGTSEPIDIDPGGELYAQFRKENAKDRKRLMDNVYFNNYIYNNIRDVVQDTVDLCEGVSIDRVIFSGRSCSFPMIKDTVREVLKKNGIKAQETVLDIAKAKTAVATGACWYGLNRNAVVLNNVKANASFGIQKRDGAQREHIRYIELVQSAMTFKNGCRNGMRCLDETEEITDLFALDNNKVNFYQVMGRDARKILSLNQNHKFSKVASVDVDSRTEVIQMRVFENDLVECGVGFESGRKVIVTGQVSDEEISDATEEHYYWIIQ